MSSSEVPTSHPAASAAEPAPSAGVMVARNAMVLTAGQVGTTLLSIALTAALGRMLGAADFGIYYLALTSTMLAYIVVEWGQAPLLVQLVARHPDRTGPALGSALAMRALGGVAAAGVTSVAAWALGYDERTRLVIGLLVIAWIPTSLWQAFSLVFRGQERMAIDAGMNVAGKALIVLFVVPMLLLGGGMGGVLGAFAAAGACSFALAVAVARRLALPRPSFDRGVLRDLLAGGLPLVILNLGLIANNYVETVFLSRLTPPAVLGYYGAAKNIFGTLLMAAMVVINASFPRFARAAADPAAFRLEVRTVLRPVLALGALAGAGTWLFADVAIGIVYGREGFAPAADVLRLLGPTLLLLFLDMVMGSALIAAGLARRVTLAKAVALPVGAAVTWPLVAWAQARFGNGAFGAVAGFAAGEVVMLGCLLVAIPRGVLGGRLVLDLVRAALSAAVAVALLRPFPGLTPLLGIPLCIAAFGATALATGLLDRHDVSTMAQALRRRRG